MKTQFKVLLLLAVSFIFSCSSNDDDPKGSKYKITVTLNNVNATDDFVSIVAVGGNISGNNTFPMWQVNGLNQPLTESVSLGDTDFTGATTTYVIETVNTLDLVELGTQIINYGEDLTGSLKVEKNGSTIINETINLVGDDTDFTKDYSFDN